MTYFFSFSYRHKFGFINEKASGFSLKQKNMKRAIIVICTGLLTMAAHAQIGGPDRVVNVNPLRNGDGSFMKADNPLFYRDKVADTIWGRTQIAASALPDPYAFRINSFQALCNTNSVQMNWVGIQPQSDADRFEIEKSSDGGVTWKNIGTVPAMRTQHGKISYGFTYNQSLENVDLRVAAVNTAGEKRYSSVVRSACDNNNLISVDNLVYSVANVRIGSPKAEDVKLMVTNQSGLPVQLKEVGLTQGVNSFSVDMSSLSPGFYVLTIIWRNGRQESFKIIKQ
jgi:hypothetical protein